MINLAIERVMVAITTSVAPPENYSGAATVRICEFCVSDCVMIPDRIT